VRRLAAGRRARFRIEVPSYNGKAQARLGTGDDCIMLMVWSERHTAGMVLTPEDADDLGLTLRRMARNARDTHERGVSQGLLKDATRLAETADMDMLVRRGEL
jgi:hypothetical protein